MTINFYLIFLAAIVTCYSIRLHYMIDKWFKSSNVECAESRRDMYRAAHGALLLSVAYIIAELRWIMEDYSTTISTFDDTFWSFIEAGFLIYIAWGCNTACRLLRRNWNNCSLED